MTTSNALTRISKLVAALLVGVAVSAVAPGCDQASQPGSVDLGGKEGKDKITPGSTPPAAGAPEAKPKPGVTTGRSIKDRPAS